MAPIDSIPLFSLEQLIQNSGKQENISICDDVIVGINIDSSRKLFEYPVRINALIVGVCTRGCSIFRSRFFEEVPVERNSLFLIAPNTIIQQSADEEFAASILAISPGRLQPLHHNLRTLTSMLLKSSSRPEIRLSDAEREAFEFRLQAIRHELAQPRQPFSKEILQSLIAAAFYTLGNGIQRHLEGQPVVLEKKPRIKNNAQEYFKRFLQLLNDHFRTERTVTFYADKLCISPKYLSATVKQVSGHSAAEWITNYVILEAQALLKYTNKSIQEIAYHLNFANQSFFGCYFKRTTGMSPNQFRMK